MSYYISIELPFKRDYISKEEVEQLINFQDILNVCENKRTQFNLNYRDLQFPSQQITQDYGQYSYFIDRNGKEYPLIKQFDFYKPQQLIYEHSLLSSIDKLPNQSLKIFTSAIPSITQNKEEKQSINDKKLLYKQFNTIFNQVIKNRQAISRHLLSGIILQQINKDQKEISYYQVNKYIKNELKPIQQGQFQTLIRHDQYTSIDRIGYLVYQNRKEIKNMDQLIQILGTNIWQDKLNDFPIIQSELEILLQNKKFCIAQLSYMDFLCLQDELKVDSNYTDEQLIDKYQKIVNQFIQKYVYNLLSIINGNGGEDIQIISQNGFEGRVLQDIQDQPVENLISEEYEEYEEYE